MRRYITEYIKKCCRYKPSNQKHFGLLQTPVYGQRFKILAVDLFSYLPKSTNEKVDFYSRRLYHGMFKIICLISCNSEGLCGNINRRSIFKILFS